MLKLKLQYLGHLMQRVDLLEKTLMLEKTEGKRRGDMNVSKLQEIMEDRGAWCAAVHGVSKSHTRLSD